MTREELEEEVFKRLRVGADTDIPIIRDALKRKPTKDLERILEAMKKEGR
jgi:hypothetical protein